MKYQYFWKGGDETLTLKVNTSGRNCRKLKFMEQPHIMALTSDF